MYLAAVHICLIYLVISSSADDVVISACKLLSAFGLAKTTLWKFQETVSLLIVVFFCLLIGA